MSDPKDVFSEDTEGGSIGVDGMRVWKLVTVVGSGDDRQFVADATASPVEQAAASAVERTSASFEGAAIFVAWAEASAVKMAVGPNMVQITCWCKLCCCCCWCCLSLRFSDLISKKVST